MHTSLLTPRQPRVLRSPRAIAALAAALMGLGTAHVSQGTSYTWTNTGANASDYWTNSANWNPSSGIPGDISGDSAYLTNAVGNAYTSILNVSPANRLTALMLSNRLGTASLVVTQGVAPATCAVTTLTIANGGNLEIDAGGVVSNATTFAWTGTNGVMRLHPGGTFITAGAAGVNFNVSGTTGLVTGASTSGLGGTWKYNGKLSVGVTASSVSLTLNNITLTNTAIVSIDVGSTAPADGNLLIITNGAKVVSTGTTFAVCRYGGFNNGVILAGANNGTPAILDGGAQQLVIGLGQNTAPATGNWMRVDNGGVLTNFVSVALGGLNNAALPNDFGNYLVITNGGKFYSSTVNVGYGIASCGNGIIIADNGLMSMNNGSLTISSLASCPGMTGNYVRVDQGGILTNAGAVIIGGCTNAFGNTLNVLNGGKFSGGASYSITVGSGVGSASNAVNVANGGQVSCGPVYIGSFMSSSNNSLTITGGLASSTVSCTALTVGNATSSFNTASVLAGGACSLANGAIAVGGIAGASSNSLLIDGGQVLAANSATAGSAGSNMFGNVIQVQNGGLLEARTLVVNAGATGPVGGNTITNAGGIYQFTNATPTVTLNANGMVYITSGTISFRTVTNADVYGNQPSGRLSPTNMTFDGNNAFRLDTATNMATASQTYLFDTISSAPTNYVRLEMVNNGTRYRGQTGNTLTIGANGQMLCSNTSATVDLAFTNNGTLTLANSTLTFATDAVLNGTLAIDPASQVQAANLTLNAATSTLVLPPGAVGTNVTLVTCSGTLGGTFHTVSNLPSGYTLKYVNGSAGTIQLVKAVRGSVVVVK